MKIKRVKTASATCVLLLSVVLGACGAQEGIPTEATTVLSASTYTERITADGTVECVDPHYVYSSLALPVEEVLVHEGDRVAAGDLLCILDTGSIEDQIALQQAAIDLTQRSSATSVTAARHQYDIYSEDLANGTAAALVEARIAVANARAASTDAHKHYDDYKQTLDIGMNPSILAADQAVASAYVAIQQAKSMQLVVDDEDYVTDTQKEQAEDAVDSANLAYSQALQSRDSLLRQMDLSLADYARAVEEADLQLLCATTAYDAAVHALENARATSYDAISQAQLMGDVSVEELQLAQLEQKLQDAQITAQYAGVVTAVNIEVGENATGVLFVIEDPTDLVLNARVAEKDINSIAVDMPVSITPKADHSESYDGVVERIADSSGKNASGHTDTSGEDAEYKVTMTITSPDARVKIGMNAEADFLIYEQADCYSLANEYIHTDADGASYVWLVAGEDAQATVMKSAVRIVYAGKSRSVIEGDAIAEGARVLTDESYALTQ